MPGTFGNYWRIGKCMYNTHNINVIDEILF